MCQIKSEIPHDTEKDIVCYKVFGKLGPDKDPTYYGPYQSRNYNLGVTYVDDTEEIIKSSFYGGINLGAGYFHLIEKREDAFLLKTHMEGLYSDRFVVARCTIPAGTKISKGRYNVVDEIGISSICSKSFRIENEEESLCV